ncbi:Eukaryotic translation initiation factor 2 subunit 1 [Aphelenchoides besseyi]|nr:Eukaryotic translation initiation factor 2 subunit 1 [Aphelenchoides besseyi]KAI6222201.1 Eukaryotic translation initiation factor 2 subunit 1 [Aphelenchoides besseyi]
MTLSCRFYANEYPEQEETVVAKVQKMSPLGAYVTLTEFNNKEGMILLSELSRRRIRSVNKLIRIGRSEYVVVIRVDKEKGYIDLSKRRVYSKDLIQCEERFARAKAINSILRHVAEQLGYTENSQLEELYDKTAWHFDRKLKKKAAAYDIFKKALTDSTVFDECEIDQKVKDKLIEDIKKKLTPQALKIRADIEVSCFAYDGIEAVKTALIKGKECSTEDLPIKIHLIAAPLFVVTAQTMDRNDGIESVNKALDCIKNSIESAGGTFKIQMPPKAVTNVDEEEIKKRMELLGLAEDDEEGSGSEIEDDEGLVAPKGLDQAADANEAEQAKLNRPNKEEEDDEESD